jgi:hypothetical protein
MRARRRSSGGRASPTSRPVRVTLSTAAGVALPAAAAIAGSETAAPSATSARQSNVLLGLRMRARRAAITATAAAAAAAAIGAAMARRPRSHLTRLASIPTAGDRSRLQGRKTHKILLRVAGHLSHGPSAERRRDLLPAMHSYRFVRIDGEQLDKAYMLLLGPRPHCPGLVASHGPCYHRCTCRGASDGKRRSATRPRDGKWLGYTRWAELGLQQRRQRNRR